MSESLVTGLICFSFAFYDLNAVPFQKDLMSF